MISIRYSIAPSLFHGSQIDDNDQVRPYQVLTFQTSFIKEKCKITIVVGRIWHGSCPSKGYQVSSIIIFAIAFPFQYEEVILDYSPCEFHHEVCSVNTKEEEWNFYFDGASTANGGGASIVLIPSSRDVNSLIKGSELTSYLLSRNKISLEIEVSREQSFLIPSIKLNSQKSNRELKSLAF